MDKDISYMDISIGIRQHENVLYMWASMKFLPTTVKSTQLKECKLKKGADTVIFFVSIAACTTFLYD